MNIKASNMDGYIRKLIAGGENQRLDFKYCISDSRKIARTLSAFSNSDGGRLLIGVRDNGGIAGIKSDEEYYMVDTAVQLFCRPEISFSIKQHITGGKTILEVEVKKGDKKPYQVKDENGRWISYFRNNDQNLAANRVLLQVWRKEEKRSGVLVKFGKAEINLMDYLAKNESITLSKFRKIDKYTDAKKYEIYTIGNFTDYKAATLLKNQLIMEGVKGAFLAAFKNGERVPISTIIKETPSK